MHEVVHQELRKRAVTIYVVMTTAEDVPGYVLVKRNLDTLKPAMKIFHDDERPLSSLAAAIDDAADFLKGAL